MIFWNIMHGNGAIKLARTGDHARTLRSCRADIVHNAFVGGKGVVWESGHKVVPAHEPKE